MAGEAPGEAPAPCCAVRRRLAAGNPAAAACARSGRCGDGPAPAAAASTRTAAAAGWSSTCIELGSDADAAGPETVARSAAEAQVGGGGGAEWLCRGAQSMLRAAAAIERPSTDAGRGSCAPEEAGAAAGAAAGSAAAGSPSAMPSSPPQVLSAASSWLEVETPPPGAEELGSCSVSCVGGGEGQCVNGWCAAPLAGAGNGA